MQTLENKLNKCKTVKEMLVLLLNEYNLDLTPGVIVKPLIVRGLVQAAQMLGIKTQ